MLKNLVVVNLASIGTTRPMHSSVYFLAHFGPVAFFRQMIALKITLKKSN
jgi:hypothetical protein